MVRRPLPSLAEVQRILEQRRSRPMRRPPPPVVRSVAPLLRTLETRFGPAEAPLAGCWREVVGETLARVSEPVRLIRGRGGQGGFLEIRVDGPAAALVQHQSSEVLERVRLMLGADAVAKLRILQGPVRKRAAPATPAARRRPPLDAEAEAALAMTVSGTESGLRDALLKLGRAVTRAEDDVDRR